jgi:hypothetical protein
MTTLSLKEKMEVGEVDRASLVPELAGVAELLRYDHEPRFYIFGLG